MATKLQAIQKSTVENLLKQTSKKGMRAVWNHALNALVKVKGEKTNELPSEAEISNRVNAIRKELKSRLQPERFKTHKTKYQYLLTGYVGNKGERHPFIVRAPKDVIQTRINKSAARTHKAVNENAKTAKNYGKVIAWAKNVCKTSFEWKELAIALLVLTGRRTTEIMKTGKIKASKDGKKIGLFSGQLKVRSGKKAAYLIPLLADPKTVETGLKRLRKIYPTNHLTNDQVNAKVAMALNREVSKVFAEFEVNQDVKAHDLRKIYARYCYNYVLGDSNFDSNPRDFIMQIMGHTGELVGKTYESWKLDSF